MVIRRPIEFAHISLPYGFTTMPILETGGHKQQAGSRHTDTHVLWPGVVASHNLPTTTGTTVGRC